MKVLAGISSENQFRKDWIPDEVVPEVDDTALTTTAATANNSVLVQTNFASKTKKKKSSPASTTATTSTSTSTASTTTTPQPVVSESASGSAKEGQHPFISKNFPADIQKGSKTKIYETVKSVKGICEQEKKKKSIYDIGSTSESRSLTEHHSFGDHSIKLDRFQNRDSFCKL